MKLKKLFEKKAIEVIDRGNIKKFYDIIDRKYEQAMNTGSEQDKKRANFLKKYKELYPEEGFLRSCMDLEEKKGTDIVDSLLEFLDIDLYNEEDYDFFQMVLYEEITIKNYNGDKRVFDGLVETYKRRKEEGLDENINKIRNMQKNKDQHQAEHRDGDER